MGNNDSQRQDEPRVLSVLQGIKDGRVDSRSLSSADRQQLVEMLLTDGATVPEVAQILKVSERTIARDKVAIRDAYAVERDPKMVSQFVGRLVQEGELAIQRIRRLAREKSVAAAVKVDAEHRCYQIVSDLTQRLQSLGYLPTAAQRLEADLTHHIGDLAGIEQIELEANRLRAVAQHILPEGGAPLEELSQLQVQIQQAKLAVKVTQVGAMIEAAAKEEPC